MGSSIGWSGGHVKKKKKKIIEDEESGPWFFSVHNISASTDLLSLNPIAGLPPVQKNTK
jgi:hypothetical protein